MKTTYKVIKRDGREDEFNKEKIINAVEKAFISVDGETSEYALNKANNIANYIENIVTTDDTKLGIEDIQDLVVKGLMGTKRKDVAEEYVKYRQIRTLQRGNTTDKIVNELVEGINDDIKDENSNKNAVIVSTQRDLLAGEVSKDFTKRLLLPKNISEAHEDGIIHFHDADYFVQLALTNCELVNLEDMLQNGTVVNEVKIERPHSFVKACTIATQIILSVTSSTYGGCTITLTHLAPFVRDTYNKAYKKYIDNGADEEFARKFAEIDRKKAIEDGVQTFNYQINTMANTNGQAPFLSVCMYLGETEEYKEELAEIIEEFLKQRYQGFKNEQGVYITPAFPKLLYILEEDNIYPDSKYYYLTKLAAKCSVKRLTPDFISEKKMKELKKDANGDGQCYPCMGCRSFLTPYVDENGKPKYYGRFNQGVVTINLVDAALSSGGDEEKFWKLMDERTELCHKALQIRHKRIASITSDVAPILWQHGAFARLKKGESVHKLLHNGYSTLSLGYAGLYECVKFMTGESHTEESIGKPFGIRVMKYLNDRCTEWKLAEKIDYSLYGTPLESTTYKFARKLRERFGTVEGITDRNYITNSYHVPVFEKIDAFDKILVESEFQSLSPGGAISYIELPDMNNNIDAILELISFIYEHIQYCEFNTKSDYCEKCGYDGEIKIIDEDGKLIWECPECGNRDQNYMHVTRRTCGYIGTQFWNQGRTQEIKERILHLDNEEYNQ